MCDRCHMVVSVIHNCEQVVGHDNDSEFAGRDHL
jgi:hypothetical protein